MFFQRLIEAFGLPRFHLEHANGKDKIGAALARVRLERTRFWSSLQDILIVGDNDDDPNGSFYNICNQINDMIGAAMAPSSPLQPTNTKPRITILMVPWTDVNGNLECLCCGAARSAAPKFGDHVDDFLNSFFAKDAWKSDSRFGKAWLRSNLAARCADPFVTLGDVFNEKAHLSMIPFSIKNKDFSKIAQVLATLSQMKSSPPSGKSS